MEESKTEVLIVNGNQSTIKSPTFDITQSASIKFLGYHLQSNLKNEKTVNALVSKIKQMVGRIWPFPDLPMNYKITLYYAYVQSLVMSNSSCILPFVSKNQSIKIQRACNNAIRAIVTLKWKKNGSKPTSISKIRQNLEIPSIVELSQRSIALKTWKSHLKFEEATNKVQHKYNTRNGNLLRIPSEIGPNRWSIWSKIIKFWNGLQSKIKSCQDPKRAKVLIKKLYRNQSGIISKNYEQKI